MFYVSVDARNNIFKPFYGGFLLWFVVVWFVVVWFVVVWFVVVWFVVV